MKWAVTLIFLLACIGHIENAKILAIFPTPAKSHFGMFGRILKELVKKGHEVDVFSHFPLEKPLPRYNDISLVGTVENPLNNITADLFTNTPTPMMMYLMMSMGGLEPCKAAFKSPTIQALRNTTKKYDLILTEIFSSDCMVGWSHHFGIPNVAITSSVNLPWASERFGLPDNPSYIPNYFEEFLPEMNLYERVRNTVTLLYTKAFYNLYSVRNSNKLAKAFFGPDLPDLKEIMQNTSLLLLNSHFSINHARPMLPNIVEVAGIHINEPKPLDEHFQKLVQADTNGVIYLTMGSMVLTETFPIQKLQAMFDAFAELPYKVIWKAKKENFEEGLKFPENIHFETWLPQLDILCNPNVKLFVSHGGLMGTQEAIYCGIPTLGIPLFADQELNIRQSQNMGIALKVDYNNITKESITEAAKELLENPIYKKNAKKMSEYFKDRPATPLDTAIYWIEYVIRHKGAPKLRSAAIELSWYQYYLLDVGLILGSIVLVGNYVLYLIAFNVYKRITGSSKIKTE